MRKPTDHDLTPDRFPRRDQRISAANGLHPPPAAGSACCWTAVDRDPVDRFCAAANSDRVPRAVRTVAARPPGAYIRGRCGREGTIALRHARGRSLESTRLWPRQDCLPALQERNSMHGQTSAPQRARPPTAPQSPQARSAAGTRHTADSDQTQLPARRKSPEGDDNGEPRVQSRGCGQPLRRRRRGTSRSGPLRHTPTSSRRATWACDKSEVYGFSMIGDNR